MTQLGERKIDKRGRDEYPDQRVLRLLILRSKIRVSHEERKSLSHCAFSAVAVTGKPPTPLTVMWLGYQGHVREQNKIVDLG
jgi:hypothetical protein